MGPAGLAATFRSLRHRNYRLYFLGQLVSLNGTWMQTAALTWLAYQLTRQSKWPALIAMAHILPTMVFGVWGGTLADRWPKRSLLLVTQSGLMALALVLAGMTLAGGVTPWHLLAVTAAAGVVHAIDFPARLAFVVEMVGREDLMNAVALNSLLFNVARALGPALAGVLLLSLGPGLCFLANGLSYVAVLFALQQMDPAVGAKETVPGDDGGAPRPGAKGLALGGFRELAANPPLLLVILTAGVLAMCGWPVLALLPAIAQLRLGAEERGYSAMLCGVGVGALAAALTVARFGTFARRRAFLAAGVCLTPAGLLALAAAADLPVAVGCCAVVGFGLILFLATGQSVVQLSAGDRHRGQIMGVWAMALSGAVPLGSILAGLAADQWGPSVTMAVQGLLCLPAVAALLALFVLHRRLAGPQRLPQVHKETDA